jgi:hypothetical protein
MEIVEKEKMREIQYHQKDLEDNPKLEVTIFCGQVSVSNIQVRARGRQQKRSKSLVWYLPFTKMFRALIINYWS